MFIEHLSDAVLGSPRDDFVIAEWRAEVGTHRIAPLHVHHGDDEAWYILDGTLGFRLGDREFEASAGSAVLARKGTSHTYWNAGPTEARYLLVMAPRIARLVEAIHVPGVDVPAVFTRFDSAIVPDELGGDPG
jgi:mannose-6-phosphate isomerase-like protein (cupin superfamily)